MKARQTKWINYWVFDPFWGGIDYLIFQILRIVPLKYVSYVGGIIGSLAQNRFKKACTDTLTNLENLYPESTTDENNQINNNMWKNIARTLTEIAVLDKFELSRHSQERNLQIFNNLDRKRPAVFLFPHLGNWELLAMSVINQGFTLNVIFEFVPNRFQRRLLVKSRQRIGYELISPNYSGTRQILRAMSSGQSIGMAMDEFKDEKVNAPVFSGAVNKKSNIHYAVALARRFNAPLVMGYCKRSSGINFEIYYAEPIKLDDSVYLGRSDEYIADIINQQCKEWVIDNPEQWYMLHRSRLSLS